MTVHEAAQIYVDLVHLEELLAPDQDQARQEVGALRSKYHDLFTQTLRETGIACADRYEATQRAFELVASNADNRGDFYTTGDGRQYEIRRSLSWQLRPQGGFLSCCFFVRPVSSTGFNPRWIPFVIGCDLFIGGEVYVNREDHIPEELAPLTIQWLLEEAGEPPIGYSYRGVFKQKGLRHRRGQAEDPRFGEQACPTLPHVVEQMRHTLLTAKERGRQRQIGFCPSGSEFWTQESEIVQPV